VGQNYGNVKFAVLTQMTLPGAPSVYYGDEVGLPGSGDPDNRRTYPWVDKGGTLPDATMYAHFKKVIGIRNTYPALRGGDMEALLTDDVYAFARWTADQTVIVALKNTVGNVTKVIPVGKFVADGTLFTDALNGGTYTVSGGNVTVPVNGKWGVILVDGAPSNLPAPTPTATPYPTPQPTATPQVYAPRTITGTGSFSFGCEGLYVQNVGQLANVTLTRYDRYPTNQPTGRPLPRAYHVQGNVHSGIVVTLPLR